MDAGKLMEEFMLSGKYGELKTVEVEKDLYKDKLKDMFDNQDEKRLELDSHNLVLKLQYRPTKVDVDTEGLVEHLADTGVLPYVCQLNKEVFEDELMAPFLENFRQDRDPVPVPSFNKKGKELKKEWEPEPIPEFEDIGPYATMYLRKKEEYETLLLEYNKLKEQWQKCPVLKEKGKVQHEYGSVYLKKSKPTYDMVGIAEDPMFGMDFLQKNTKIMWSEIDNMIYKGVLKQGEIDKFRTVLDKAPVFVVVDAHTEQEQMAFLRDKRIQASLNAGY